MKEEYIIISKTATQKRIEELEQDLSSEKDCGDPIDYLLGEYKGNINALKQILSQSTPLIPEIEKAFNKGILYSDSNWKAEDYISTLKLEI